MVYCPPNFPPGFCGGGVSKNRFLQAIRKLEREIRRNGNGAVCCPPQLVGPQFTIFVAPGSELVEEVRGALFINVQQNPPPHFELIVGPIVPNQSTAEITNESFVFPETNFPEPPPQATLAQVEVTLTNTQQGDFWIVALVNDCGCGTVMGTIFVGEPEPQ